MVFYEELLWVANANTAVCQLSPFVTGLA